MTRIWMTMIAVTLAVGISAVRAAAEEPHSPAAVHPSTGTPADAAHAPDAHSAQPNIFGGGIGNMIWTTIIFGAVVYILGQKAWPPLIKALNDREHSIRISLENAKREREEAEKLLAKYREQIDQARKDATAIVDEGRRDAEEVRRRVSEEAKRESDEMLARAKREIQLATDTAVKDLYDRTAELAVQVASGIIKKELRADDHRALVTESLQRMGSRN